MQRQSWITEACSYLLKPTISWNRNAELLPEHLRIMQSSHIPNVLCCRIILPFVVDPPFQSKQYDIIHSTSPLSYFLHYLSCPTEDLPTEAPLWHLSSPLCICFVGSRGNLKPSHCPDSVQQQNKAGVCVSRLMRWNNYRNSVLTSSSSFKWNSLESALIIQWI